MLEKIIQRQWYLQKHLEASLLKEREDYLCHVASQRDYRHNYMLSLADYLLLIVTKLDLKEGGCEKISIERIKQAAEAWSHTQKDHPMKRTEYTPNSYGKFMNVAFAWLEYIGRLDNLYTGNSIINRLFSRKFHKLRYLTYPMLKERMAYIEFWEKRGATRQSLREIAAYQLHLLDYFGDRKPREINENELKRAAKKWATVEKSGIKSTTEGHYAYMRFMNFGVGWFSYLGIYEPTRYSFPHKNIVDAYLESIVNEKGYSTRTAEGRYSMLKTFFSSISEMLLSEITPLTLDEYLEKRHADGCNRRTIAITVTVLRCFFHYAADNNLCERALALSLKAPRIYTAEDVPSFVPWDAIQAIIEKKTNCRGRWLRDYPVFLLLAVYGMRCSEVTGLRLTDIDWRAETIYLRRAKNCRHQILPLLPIVGDAIIRYIKEARFNNERDECLFLTMRAPHKPITTSSVYQMVSMELKVEGVRLRHYGPHSLRHACATRLINTGHSLKEIADLLGHVRLDTTRIYAKVDLNGLRQVADMNWEGVL